MRTVKNNPELPRRQFKYSQVDEIIGLKIEEGSIAIDQLIVIFNHIEALGKFPEPVDVGSVKKFPDSRGEREFFF